MKRLALMVGVSAVIVGALTGCSKAVPIETEDSTPYVPQVTITQLTTPDGDEVNCAVTSNGGLDCWEATN